MGKGKLIEGLKSYLAVEIVIEYKACLYFFVILFFCCVYRMLCGSFQISILHMGEMIMAAYLMEYLQVYLLWNFDEAERLGRREICCILFCTALYTAASWGGGWLERDVAATLSFAAFLVFAYWCVYLIHKIKRAIDTENLNRMLTEYKGGQAAGQDGNREVYPHGQ